MSGLKSVKPYESSVMDCGSCGFARATPYSRGGYPDVSIASRLCIKCHLINCNVYRLSVT